MNNDPQDSYKIQPKKESSWKTFKEYIPYLSGLIILLGLIRQMIYYYHYNIEIQNYIGASELLLAWADESILFFYFILPLLFMLNLYAKYQNDFQKFLKLRTLRTIYIYTLSVLLVFIVLSILDSYIVFKRPTLFFFKMASLLLLLVGVFNVIVAECASVLFKSNNIIIFKFVFASCSFLAFIFLLTNQSIKNVDNGNFIGTTIVTKDSTYISDRTHYYIGKTEKYYFIFNKDKKTTLIIPEREVLKFELKGHIPIINLDED
jgi:hypothetical protein